MVTSVKCLVQLHVGKEHVYRLAGVHGDNVLTKRVGGLRLECCVHICSAEGLVWQYNSQSSCYGIMPLYKPYPHRKVVALWRSPFDLQQ